ncbi:HD-GYP domain-containing protein [Paenibacillus sacheonensis]|uniref:HD domain-containing protein n=1 Tax=Paenibacillus sacheonensis TaxID=742054 RepID=A0A7X5C294_9BACL|nr:HD-GYP domain-containing protein [Paenibacillus sacheonensis]MBM7565118.1 HD-GYP domain-containing protein (c-di-GMP phosphodiesterase class II) [Paenibacillus sacheonensis]NBC70099.1 HD domain-containing protein [Paenibacillus sacheonensis]
MRQYLGKITKNDMVNAFGVTVLPAGILLREEHLALLERHGIEHVTVNLDHVRPASGAAEPPHEALGKMREQAKSLYASIEETGQVPLTELEAEIVPVVKVASGHPNIFELFEAVKAHGDYTYEHNIGVGVLSTMIGRWLGFGEDELTALTIAATLHDVGKVKIPQEILNKPSALTAEEYELMKKHAIYGYEILRKTEGVSYRTALVALQHHEREDGSGYPLGLTSDKIDLFSKIVAVADIFHAMSSDRPYHKALPFHEVVRQLREGFFGQLDPAIVMLFLDNITSKLVGQQVLLTDGRIGEIVFINPQSGEAQLVRSGEEFIDLTSHRKLKILRIIGF